MIGESPRMLACGNCVYYALWLGFPPIATAVIVVPLWLIILSGVRTFGGIKLTGVPPAFVTLPLVFLVVLYAPGMIGPPLGFWMPICCLTGTLSVFLQPTSRRVKAIIGALAGCVALAMILGGVSDYAAYDRMPPAERAKLRVGHQLRPPAAARADDIKDAPADVPSAPPTKTSK